MFGCEPASHYRLQMPQAALGLILFLVLSRDAVITLLLTEEGRGLASCD